MFFSVLTSQSKTALGDQLKEEHAKQLVTNFALKVFKIADDVDRSGKADKRTARDFLHASIFLEVCSQFGELSVEVSCFHFALNLTLQMEGYKKYAKWKAVQISQCLANGEIPPAGTAPQLLSVLLSRSHWLGR